MSHWMVVFCYPCYLAMPLGSQHYYQHSGGCCEPKAVAVEA